MTSWTAPTKLMLPRVVHNTQYKHGQAGMPVGESSKRIVHHADLHIIYVNQQILCCSLEQAHSRNFACPSFLSIDVQIVMHRHPLSSRMVMILSSFMNWHNMYSMATFLLGPVMFSKVHEGIHCTDRDDIVGIHCTDRDDIVGIHCTDRDASYDACTL